MKNNKLTKEQVLKFKSKENNKEIIEILNSIEEDTDLNLAFLYSSSACNIEIMDILINNFNVNPAMCRNSALESVAKKGDIKAFDYLMNNKETDFFDAVCNPLIRSIYNGHFNFCIEVIEKYDLMSDIMKNQYGTKSNKFLHSLFAVPCQVGKFEFLQYLLNHKDVVVRDTGKDLLCACLSNDDFKTFKFLLSDERFNIGYLEVANSLKNNNYYNPQILGEEYNHIKTERTKEGRRKQRQDLETYKNNILSLF